MRTDYAGHDAVYRERRASGADGWDPPDVTTEVFRQFLALLAHPSVPSSGRLLEVGCGAGNLTVRFASLGYMVTGLDISPTAIAWAQERARALRLDIEFVLSDILGWSGEGSSFSIVIDGHCFHCLIGADRASFLSRVRHVLAPGGVLLVNTMCQNEYTHLLPGFDPATGVTEHGGIATRTIAKRSEIEAEVERAGLEVVRSEIETTDDRTRDLLLIVKERGPA